jgi:hypothetical protein
VEAWPALHTKLLLLPQGSFAVSSPVPRNLHSIAQSQSDLQLHQALTNQIRFDGSVQSPRY